MRIFKSIIRTMFNIILVPLMIIIYPIVALVFSVYQDTSFIDELREGRDYMKEMIKGVKDNEI